MLSYIDIKDVAVIEHTVIEFMDGLSVLTGETGAGKSIILDAIGMVSGSRISKDIVRTGCDKAKVSALFYIDEVLYDSFAEYGIEKSEDLSLLIQREISADGRGSVRINGTVSSVSVLKEIGPKLINIHGQQDSGELYSPDRHIHILDAYGRIDGDLKTGYTENYKKLLTLYRELSELRAKASRRETEIDILEYKINEINALSLEENEEQTLRERLEILQNSEEIVSSLAKTDNLLSNGNVSARDSLKSAVNAFSSVAGYSSELEQMYNTLCDVMYTLDDVAREIGRYSENIEFSQKELDDISERLYEIKRICTKYRTSSEGLGSILEESQKELDTLLNTKEAETDLENEIESTKNLLHTQARELHALRVKAAEKFETEMEENLSELNMKGTKFRVEIKETDFGAFGCDKLEFMISPNVGEDLKPLAKIASGGELSRIMLSLKTLDTEQGMTYIFDEIDTGISGITAEKIADRLKRVSTHNQTIIITHSAQIAAAADHHFYIEKSAEGGKTVSVVKKLSGDDRIIELARIASGSNITPAAFIAAEELLNRRKN